MKKIYMAGPLFTKAELDFNLSLAVILRDYGYQVFLPQENLPEEATSSSIFNHCMQGLNWCDVVVACMDGADPDSGTSWEVGCGSNGQKDIILYRTDIRSEKEYGPYNLMLHQSAGSVLDCKFLTLRQIAVKIDTELQ